MRWLSACCLPAALTFTGLICQVVCLETVTGIYGETLEIPCNKGAIKAEDILLTKWKYDKGEGVPGDLLVKNGLNVSVSATDDYKGRVSMADNFSLLLSDATLSDQRKFTCMLVLRNDLTEHPVNVLIHKSPADLEINDKAEELEIAKSTKLGTCVAKDSNPAADIIWLKNNKPLVADGKGISIQSSVAVDPVTRLSTTTSTLVYSAEKGDAEALFTCSTRHVAGSELVSPPVTFNITYSTENIDLKIIATEPLVEGADVTLKCAADGNPAPTSFFFHLKENLVKVENADTYTIVNVSRDTTGEYKCSLIDDPTMEASKEITVNYLDINLTPSGTIIRNVGEPLPVNLQIDSSGVPKVSWMKDQVKLDKEPSLTNVAYSHAGVYECDVTMGLLSQKAAFELVVQGSPVVKQLSQELSENGLHQILICKAEGFPKPTVTWSINGTLLSESPFINGKIAQTIAVVPAANLTVSCSVANEFGSDTSAINVSSYQSDNDQTKLVVGVVVGLLVAIAVIGLAYWVYTKKSKQGSWKTGERENGSSEEEKKLEEKVEENSQKAEV
ncbi:CD166 antigen homolog isoform X2 [Gouania willdenowi]|uniref:CD166 antigen homolog n=1 Tax=Gouania willdenowi TaxID=441366 RepID=A0A8C5H5M8_GOUWI|nr:CD166 antigen homolog isoform X2 [Gouania willdenowi]